MKYLKVLAIGFCLHILTHGQAHASCLPQIKVKPAHQACVSDQDCVLAGDGCRTCGNRLLVNRRYKADYESLDAKARQVASCSMACEACSTAQLKLSCKVGRCHLAEPMP